MGEYNPNSNIEILQRFQNKYLKLMLHGMSPIIYYIMILTCYMLCDRDEMRRFSQRYADRIEEHPNIFTINLMRNVKTSCRLKRFPQDFLMHQIVII